VKKQSKRFLKTVLFAVLPLCLPHFVRAEDDKVGKIIKYLKARDRFIRSAAAEKLGEIDDPRVVGPLVSAALKDAYSEVRKNAAASLRKLQYPSVLELLLTALEDEKPYIQSRAISILGNREESKAVESLIKILKDKDDVWYVRRKAAKALGDIEDDRAVSPLISVLGLADARIKYAVIVALEKLEDRRSIKPLILCLKDDHPQIRGRSAQTLANLKIRKAVGPLIDALEREKKPRPRAVILACLKKITKEDAGEEPSDWRAWWRENKDRFR